MQQNRDRDIHLNQFYGILARLECKHGGSLKLSECSGQMPWPKRGIYFFFERGEQRRDTGQGQRVVRVGTHALKSGSRSTLWGRLKQHQGVTKSGGGNHRGSIFRLIVGEALKNRVGYSCPSWGEGSSASKEVRKGELSLEQAVSATLGSMSFLWLRVEDEPGPNTLRGYIERNTIALLSNYSHTPIDLPSPEWLGRHSGRARVRGSGLWNSNHVDETYDPAFLDILKRLIAEERCERGWR